jgi:hypothetical protein
MADFACKLRKAILIFKEMQRFGQAGKGCSRLCYDEDVDDLVQFGQAQPKQIKFIEEGKAVKYPGLCAMNWLNSLIVRR